MDIQFNNSITRGQFYQLGMSLEDLDQRIQALRLKKIIDFVDIPAGLLTVKILFVNELRSQLIANQLSEFVYNSTLLLDKGDQITPTQLTKKIATSQTYHTMDLMVWETASTQTLSIAMNAKDLILLR
jgi:hypothetical protein